MGDLIQFPVPVPVKSESDFIMSEGSDTPICESDDCALWQLCSQHITAGDYRSDYGMTPDIFKDDNGIIKCTQTKTDGQGMGHFVNGKWEHLKGLDEAYYDHLFEDDNNDYDGNKSA